jgi:hypothetical protein
MASSLSPISRTKNPFGEWALIPTTSFVLADFQKARNSFWRTTGVPFFFKHGLSGDRVV